VLFREYIACHGVIRRLHSDQGVTLNNQLTLELCKARKIYKARTTAYARLGNVMVERSSKIGQRKAILEALDVHDKENWDELLT